MSYKEDVHINKHALDEEWLRQPVLFLEYSEKLANAQYDRDRAKECFEVTKAEMDKKVREDPVGCGVNVKVTEAVVSSTVSSAIGVREAHSQYLEAVNDARVLEVAKEAIKSKGDALKNITSLWMQNYFANADAPKPIQEQMDKATKDEQTKALSDNARLASRKETPDQLSVNQENK